MNLVSRLANALFEFLFPKSERVLSLEHLTPAELISSLPAAERIADSHTLALFSYDHPLVRELIWELKYRGNRVVAEKLAVLVHDLLTHELAERALFDKFEHPLLIPMPISGRRRNERGYSQTEILAQKIKKFDTEHRLKLVTGQLVKHLHTNPQTLTATKSERLGNVRESMHVMHPPSVAGKCVIVLDDVTTTGATFAEARRALREAGAKQVLCVAIAH